METALEAGMEQIVCSSDYSNHRTTKLDAFLPDVLLCQVFKNRIGECAAKYDLIKNSQTVWDC